MRTACAVIAAGAVTTLLAGLPSAASGAASASAVAPAALALAPGVTAFYEMDEPAGTTVMRDSGPHGLDATVDPTGVTSGFGFDGATGYSWSRRPPADTQGGPGRGVPPQGGGR